MAVKICYAPKRQATAAESCGQAASYCGGGGPGGGRMPAGGKPPGGAPGGGNPGGANPGGGTPGVGGIKTSLGNLNFDGLVIHHRCSNPHDLAGLPRILAAPRAHA